MGFDIAWDLLRSSLTSSDPAAVALVEQFAKGMDADAPWHERVGTAIAGPARMASRRFPALRPILAPDAHRLAAEVMATAAHKSLVSGSHYDSDRFRKRAIDAFSHLRHGGRVISDVLDRHARIVNPSRVDRLVSTSWSLDSTVWPGGRPITIAFPIGSLDTVVATELVIEERGNLERVAVSTTGSGLADAVISGQVTPDLIVLSREGAARILRHAEYEPVYLLGDVHHSVLRAPVAASSSVDSRSCQFHAFRADLSTNQSVYYKLRSRGVAPSDPEPEHIEGESRRALLRAGSADDLLLVTEPDGLFMRLDGLGVEVATGVSLTTPSFVLAHTNTIATVGDELDRLLRTLLEARSRLARNPRLLTQLCLESNLLPIGMRSPACSRNDRLEILGRSRA